MDDQPKKVADSFTSFVNGLGNGAIPTYMGLAVSTLEADAAFVDSTWYGKILNIPVDDAVKEWRAWQAEAPQIELLEAEESRLGYREAIRQALRIARHTGGGVLLPVGLPGDPSQPLVLDRIGKGALKRIVSLDRNQISPGPIIKDPLDDYFALPEFWTINAMKFHPSRVCLVNGIRPPGSSLHLDSIWGVPIWSHLRKSILASDQAASVIMALLEEGKIDIVSIPELANMLMTPEGEASLMRRWNAAARLKSISNITLIDGGPNKEGTKAEEWDQKQISWSGLSESVNTLLMIMCGASDIPATRLLGEQQTGLSGSDSGSKRDYNDRIASRQKLEITPQISSLDEMLIRSALGSRPPEIWYQWRALDQMDEKTAAEVDKLQAETASIYAREALLPTEALEKAVHNRMIESGRWPGLEAALEDIPEEDRYTDPDDEEPVAPDPEFQAPGEEETQED